MARVHQPCDGCPRRKSCAGVCPPLAAYGGRRRPGSGRAFRIEESRALTQKILDLRDEMDADDRKIIDMFYVEQMNQRQIAGALGLSQATVCRMLQRAHERVHELYHDSVSRFKEKARRFIGDRMEGGSDGHNEK